MIGVVTLTRDKTAYELEVDYSWEDRRMGLLRWQIESVTVLDGPKPEHDVDPTVFTESLTDDETAEIESQIKDRS